MRSTKENWIEERCDAIEKGMKAGNSKDPYDTRNDLTKASRDQLLRRVLDIHCQVDSSQCLAQLTPARDGKARSVHVQLGASPHVIR